jgi:hypothetical protein
VIGVARTSRRIPAGRTVVLTLAAAIACVAVIAGCVSESGRAADERLTIEDSGRVLSVDVGDVILIELPPARGGWSIMQIPDSMELSIERQPDVAPGDDRQDVASLASFYFRVRGEGEGTLVMVAASQDERKPADDEFVLGVVVSKQGG